MRDKAIRNTHPTVVTINADKDAWDEDGTQVTLDEAKIAVEIARLQAEYDSKQYARDRLAEYPPIGDQLDALWKGGQSQADMKLIIDGVKATYPKV